MLSFLFLLSCGCPSFEEMVVEDRTGVADAAFLDEIEVGIARFAERTGRDGVCVPGVVVVEDAWPRRPSAAGRYRGPRRPILMEPVVRNPYRVTLHELCHALDAEEGHSEARPDLFPASDVEASYSESLRSREEEAFARACAWGARDLGVYEAVEETCGVETVSAQAWYLRDEVYPAVPQTEVETDSIALTVASREVSLTVGVVVLGLAAVGDRLLIVVDGYTGWPDAGTWLYALDPASGEVEAYLDLALERGDVVLAQSDGPVVVLMDRDADGEAEIWTADERGTLSEVAPVGALQPQGAVVSDGVVVVSGYLVPPCDGGNCLTEGRMAAWDLETGAALDSPAEGLGYARSLALADGAIELSDNTRYGRYDPRTGGWSARDLPSGLSGLGVLGPERRLFLSGDASTLAPVLYDRAAETWHLAAEPCLPGAGYRYVATLEGRAYLLGGGLVGEEGTLPLLVVGEG